jgi:outer membrane receptor protein involved in Fe transport
MFSSRLLIPTAALFAFCNGGGLNWTPAAAQDSRLALEEIVVTARKREESLLEVPISVNAFSAEDIARAGAYDIKDVAEMSTSLTFQTNQSASSFQGRMSGGVAFRGAQLGVGVSARDNTGSVFIDGVFLTSGLASVSTSDVERVEVLKGPQNTYFGRNTFSGAVNFVTRNPGNEFKGQVQSSATARGSYDVDTSLEGPIAVDKLAGRLVLNLHRKAAMYTATDGGELGKEGTRAAVATLYATPNDDFWARLRVNYQEDEDGPSQSTFLRGTQYGSCSPSATMRQVEVVC